MQRSIVLLGAALLAIAPVLAEAGNHKDKGNHKNKGASNSASVGHCPPGLAKKNNGCLPPGQAKKYARGEYINGEYTRIRNPERYGLKPGESYYRVGDDVYRVDEDTREVLDLIGAIGAVLN